MWGLLLARSQDMFYKSSGEIRDRSEDQALYYLALAGGAFVSSTLQYYGQSQVCRNTGYLHPPAAYTIIFYCMSMYRLRRGCP